MYSKSFAYAVQALVVLSRGAQTDPEKKWLSGELAEATGVPASFLSKVLQTLASGGLIESVRGRGGGIKAIKNSDEITLYDIACVTDPAEMESTGLPGWDEAPQGMKNILDKRWSTYGNILKEFLTNTTIATLSDYDD